jgi:hypothetical protein
MAIIKKSTSNRTANEMFLKMVIDQDCLSDSHLKMMATIANTFWKQSQFSIEIKRQNTEEGPNVP